VNILVVRTDKLGDFITALPTMYVLKHHDPKNRVIACVAPLNRALAEACAFIDEVIVDEGEPLLEFVAKLKEAKIDTSITLFSNTRVALAQFLARIPKRIAPATKLAQLFYTTRVKQRRSEVKMAEFEYNLELSKTLFPTISLAYPQPLLPLDKQESESIYNTFCNNYKIEKPIIAFHPGFGGSSDANLTMIEYVELVKIVIAGSKYQAIMTFGPGDERFLQEAKVLTKGIDVILYESSEGLLHFAKLISSFKLFVSTSTGTYHLAALVGTSTMTFFGASLFASVKRWKAVSDVAKQQAFMLPTDKSKIITSLNQV